MSNLIISENYLKEYSNINKNVDMSILTPALLSAQQIYIHPLLGTKLYNQILSEVNTVPPTVSALNQTLLDNYVIPCLIHYAKYDSIPDLKYRLMNKGIMTNSTNNSSPADLQEIQFLMDKEKSKAELFADRTVKYLCNNSTSYPLYSTNTEYDEIKPIKNPFTSGIYVGDDDECGCDLD